MNIKDYSNEIPPLFCELDELSQSIDNNQYECWREKARWIKFEEHAEDVLGRWSKPHVTTLTQTSIDDLNHLIKEGVIMLDLPISSIQDIADTVANELLSYFNDIDHARNFAELMCLPHIHHHEHIYYEKKSKHSASGSNLSKLASTNNLQDFTKKDNDILNQVKNSSVNLKYQYSFTDSMALDDLGSCHDFKENTKFKRKVSRKAEGASILIAPLSFVNSQKLVFIRLNPSIELNTFLEVRLKSKFIVLIIGPPDKHNQIYEAGRVIATCLADDVCRELLYTAQEKQDILNAVNKFNHSAMLLPPIWDPKTQIEPPDKTLSKEERKKLENLEDYIHDQTIDMNGHTDPNLKGSKRPFNGIKCDIKRKLAYYLSDITDCFNIQCFATTLYLYLVSLCSLVAFGALLSKYTRNEMGIVECILSGAISGIFFSLFSGQPLNILSATGPMLILEGIIYRLCREYSLDFMEFRLWIGLWAALILVLFSIFNLSFLVKYITRFTEDCFASLVAIMFIIDAIKSTISIYSEYPTKIGNKLFKTQMTTNNECICNNTLNSNDKIKNCFINGTSIACNEKLYPDIFLFSILLFITTFSICLILKNFRQKNYFPAKIRQTISDFSVLLAILFMSIVDLLVGLDTPKLVIPYDFSPTNSKRNWFVPLVEKNKLWSIPLALLPAIVTTILIFMDQQITAVIVNKKEFKLKKSYGYHLDLLVVGIIIAVTSMLGCPWFVAATVLALTHVNSLKVMSENTAPGEKPLFLGVKEQRMTSLLISILIGCSIFFTPVLQNIPKPVLYAVFLFMGVNTLNGIQFFDRIFLLFMPNKYQPEYAYLKHVRIKRIHLFTIIQLFSIIGLILVKSIEAIAILLPVMILATGGIRKLLDFVFTQTELFWLDDLFPSKESEKSNKNGEHTNMLLKELNSVNFSKSNTESTLQYDRSENCIAHQQIQSGGVKFATHFPLDNSADND